MTHGGATAAFDGSGIQQGVAPMYWLMPLGLFLGFLVVAGFESLTAGWRLVHRRTLIKSLTHKHQGVVLHPGLESALRRLVNGPGNVLDFWSGGALFLQPKKDHLVKAYETVALISALLLAISVTFYTREAGDHLYGLIGCVSNCALWMATLSSAFFMATISTCETDDQVSLLIALYGSSLMRVPMGLFVWGSLLLFSQFVLFFKLNVDPGFNCSACLASCLVFLPLFFHCMHKMGWAATVVHKDAELEKRYARTPSPDEVRASLDTYIHSKGFNILELDKEEFLDLFQKPHVRATSVLRAYAERAFDAHVEVELMKLAPSTKCCEDLAKAMLFEL